jgi:hypothetical protein
MLRNNNSGRLRSGILATAALLAAGACADSTAASRSLALSTAALRASLSSVPVGYGSLTSSYVGAEARSAGSGGLWLGGGRDAGMDRGALMGGGISDDFVGGIGRGHGFGHEGPFGGGLRCSGTFVPATGRVTCPTATLRNGLTVNSSAAYTDAAGAVQQAFDSITTNTVNLQNAVTGTVVFTATSDSMGDHDGDEHGDRGHGWGEGRGPDGELLGDTSKILTATTTVNSSSDRTVSGLAKGSTQRTANGKSAGSESTVGTSSRGSFTATRAVGDTTLGLVVPLPTSGPTYPTAGTVIRSMKATLTYAGAATATVTRREVVTYDGSATAKVVITEDGTTKNCTRALPHGRLSCP